MIERSNDATPRPLPRDWLPEAAPCARDPEWEARAERIIAAAEPSLQNLAGRRSAFEAPWSTRLGAWWKPSALLAATAAALFILLDPPVTRGESGSLPLNVVAADGEPFTLWEAAGVDVDPVLALIALQESAR